MPDTRVTHHYPNARQGSVGARGYMAAGKNIDVGGVRPLVSRTEINCGRPGVSSRTGKPAYKSQEEQYQEIQELRQGLGHLREENSTLRTRSRRLEEDLARRDRQIQQLMDPTKNDEARRKLTDKGASLVASLKLRVSRLEATLRAKEGELARLHASAKATSLNEMKIEAETYYQEVVRLRNQLNIVQQQQQQQQQQHQYFPVNQHPEEPHHAPPPPPPHSQAQVNTAPQATHSTMRGKRDSREREREREKEAPQDRRGGGDGQESPSASLRQALSRLEEENTRLGQQVSALVSEKEKLTADLERVLGLTEEVKGNFEGLSRAELIREVERREAEVVRWESQHKQLTDALGRHSEQAGENSALLQARVAELQAREEEWNRERLSLQELINTLKDDRIFYKETAQKKDSEMDGLRQEVQALQQEVSGLQEAQRRRGDRLAASTPRSTRPGAVSASSRSGSSSEAHTPPSRRARPSSARPPPAGTRPPRHTKASSEPRESASPRRTTTTTTTTTQSRKPPVTKSSSTRTASSSVSSPSQMSPRKQPAPASRGKQSRQPTPSSSFSSKTSTPTASPSKVPARVTSASSSSSPQHRSSLSSPQQRNTTPRLSRQQNGSVGSPQHKDSAAASPRHRNGVVGSPRVKPASPVKTPTPRSSSRSSTPSSQVRSSPSKVTASPRSPSKVPQPSPRGRKGAAAEAPQPPPQHTPRRQASSGLSSTEEDERVLAELIFQRDTDTSIEAAPDTPRSMARQRTVTLDTQEEESLQEHTSLSSQGISSREEEEVKEEEEETGKRRRRKDREIAETLDVLRSLLSGHLSRQQEVNHLLTSAPLLVGEGQGGGGGGALHSPRGGGGQARRSPRQAPEGAEGSGKTLVRQGTFNVDEEGVEGEQEAPTALHATLDAHLTRTKGVRQLK